LALLSSFSLAAAVVVVVVVVSGGGGRIGSAAVFMLKGWADEREGVPPEWQ